MVWVLDLFPLSLVEFYVHFYTTARSLIYTYNISITITKWYFYISLFPSVYLGYTLMWFFKKNWCCSAPNYLFGCVILSLLKNLTITTLRIELKRLNWIIVGLWETLTQLFWLQSWSTIAFRDWKHFIIIQNVYFNFINCTWECILLEPIFFNLYFDATFLKGSH